MDHSIYTLKAGINRCYLLKGKNGMVLIDAGQPNSGKKFARQLNKLQLSPKDIRLIVLTHGDFDHAGSAKELKAMTGADVAIHKEDREMIERGIFSWAPGVTAWGKISRSVFYPLMRKMKISRLKPDIILDNDGMFLDTYGLNGKIIHTPGHTTGSISVLLETGDAFVGCMAHNFFLFTLKPRLPIYARDIDQLKQSWKTIIHLGAATIYPGHGNPFDVQKMMKYL